MLWHWICIFIFLVVAGVASQNDAKVDVTPSHASYLTCPCAVDDSSCHGSAAYITFQRSKKRFHRTNHRFFRDLPFPGTVHVELDVFSSVYNLSHYTFARSVKFEWASLPVLDFNASLLETPELIFENASTIKNDKNEFFAALVFELPEAVIRMRLNTTIRLLSMKHAICKQILVFDQAPAVDLQFTCEHSRPQQCISTIPPYSPFCTSPGNVSTSLVRRDPYWVAFVEVRMPPSVTELSPLPDPNLEYAVLYGICSPAVQDYGFSLNVQRPQMNHCQLRLDSIWKHSICRTPINNCTQPTIIRIPNVVSSLHYAVLICSFSNAAPFPHNRTMLEQLVQARKIELPYALLHNTPILLKDEIRTFLAYGSILVILFGLMLITVIQKRRQRKPLAADMLQFLKADEWELNDTDVAIFFACKLGSGTTSDVYRAKLSKDFRTPANGPVVLDDNQQVAVKTLKKTATEAQKNEFLAEMEMSKAIGRSNKIVNLLGVMQLRRPPLIVREVCPNGDLKMYLRNSLEYTMELDAKGFKVLEVDDIHSIPKIDEESLITVKRVIRMAIQISVAMEYLASRQLIHGDLAARNIFLTANFGIKIGDFGLCRKESDTAKLSSLLYTPLRARWAAPEILRLESQHTTSDVWSFGVVLYEIVTLGAVPYHALTETDDILSRVRSGYRLEKPQFCSSHLYDVMMACWTLEPDRRPSFTTLSNSLSELYDSIDTRDNKANHYITSDPNREIYTLPAGKSTTFSIGCDDGNSTSAPPTTSRLSILRSTGGSSSTMLGLEPRPPTRVELLHEAERLLGFS